MKRVSTLLLLGLAYLTSFGQQALLADQLELVKQHYQATNDLFYDGEYAAAEKGFLKVRQAYLDLGQDSLEAFAKTLYKLGDVNRKLRNHPAALDWYHQAEVHYKRLTAYDTLILADIVYDKATVYSQMYQPQRAMAGYDSCIAAYSKAFGAKSEAVANTYMSIGLDLVKTNSFQASEGAMLKALAIFQEISDSTSENFNRIYNNLGIVYRKQGDLDRALNYARKALHIKLKNYEPTHPSVAKYHGNIGAALIDLDRAEEAIPYYQTCLDIYEKILGKGHPETAGALGELSSAYAEAGQFAKAERLLRRSNRLIQTQYPPYHPYLVAGIYNLGMLKLDVDDNAAALPFFEECLRRFHLAPEKAWGEIAKSQSQIGYTLLRLKQANAALPYIDSALTLLGPDLLPILRQAYTPLAAIQQATRSVQDEQEVLLILQRRIRALHQGVGLDTLDQLTFILGHSETASSLLSQVRSGFSGETSKQLLRERWAEFYDLGIDAAHRLYQRSGDPSYLERALQLSNEAKAGVLRDQLDLKAKLNLGGVSVTQQAALFKLISEVNALRSSRNPEKTAERLLELQQLNQRLTEEYPKYAGFVPRNAQLSVAELQDGLPPGGQLLDYYLYDTTVYCVILEKDLGLRGQQLTLSAESQGNLQALITQYSTTNFGELDIRVWQENRSLVYQQLFAPLALKLSHKRLHICADGLLHAIPFGALGQSTKAYAKTHYVLSDFAITYVAAPELLVRKPRAAADFKVELLAYAPFAETNSRSAQNFNFSRLEMLDPLQHSLDEVQQATSIFRGQPFVGAAAVKSAFTTRAEESRIIHLASHAYLNDQEPARSGVYFAVNQLDSSGFLSTEEIYALDLPAELVVLSACNTAAGKLATGEGRLSLGRAFSFAGSKAVLASQWLANDASTAAVIDHFYDNLAQGKPKDVALQEAKLTYLQTADPLRAHPYFWAGLVLTGDSAALSNKSTLRLSVWWFAGAFLLGLGLLAWKKKS